MQFSETKQTFDMGFGQVETIHGQSAYEIAVKNGFEGSETEWLESLHGKDGVNGKDGHTPKKGVDYYTEAEKTELVEEIEQTVTGDIETALDSIIAIQNSLIGIISFTVFGEPCTAISGMTWEQWCSSEYNTHSYEVAIYDDIVQIEGIDMYSKDGTKQYGTSLIVDGGIYGYYGGDGVWVLRKN